VDAYQAVLRALNYTGVEQHSVSDSRCRVYPNPVSSSAYVVIESDASNLEAMLYDMSGRQLMRQTVTSGVNHLDMQAYAPGCYFIKIYDGKNIITKKIIKQ
ncbi:MAG: T9SS type A sorting domain-containing protein, partial [Bacteroidales bacterium]|nr:T9SS type A sorting domain-containing protein [Bacteroidales bacterium]